MFDREKKASDNMIINYIKDKLKILILFIVFLGIFSAVFFLYNLPLDAIRYGGMLFAVVLLVVICVDFAAYCRKHKALQTMKKNIFTSIEEVREPNNLIEADYWHLLQEYHREYRELRFLTDSSKTEMVDFYTLWVHQIKTPIAAMSAFLQSSGSTIEEKNVLQQELFKIQRYVELVLGYLRVDSISSDLNFEEFNLDRVVKIGVKKYAPIFIHKKITPVMENLDITVTSDEKWLLFVFEQLLSNALKYTEEGSIRIFVQEKGGRILLVVQDSGIGIRAEDLPRVFEKGFTGFNGRMEKKSTGLGLYLCRKTLDKLGHEIWIESKRFSGTSVYIDLSRKKIIGD